MTLPEPKFNFGEDFQRGILALMVSNYAFLVTAVEIIKPTYFESKSLIYFFKKIRDYFLDYKKIPTKEVITNELLKDVTNKVISEDDIPMYTDNYKHLWVPIDAQNYVIKEVVNFCKRQELKKTILEIADYIETASDDQFVKIENQIKAACNTGNYAQDIGVQYFSDYKERLRRQQSIEDNIVVPTGITELDFLCKGGLYPGQMGIWVGGTGGGKSLALSHVGKRAVMGNLVVVHITLELSEDIISSRYDAALTKLDFSTIEEHHTEVETKLGKLATKYGNSLIIKYFPRGTITVDGIRAFLNNLEGLGVKPDLVIVDYGDLLKPSTNYNDEYADLGGIFSELSGLAGEKKIALLTASQTNRDGVDAEIVDLRHMADSFKKTHPADLIFGICRNRDEKNNNRARVYIQKNRNGPEGKEVPIATDYATMRFYDPIASAKLYEEMQQDKQIDLSKAKKIKAKYFV